MDASDRRSRTNPVLYFTWGNHTPNGNPVFIMAFAKFDGANWNITKYLDDKIPGGGVSSHDGSRFDFIFNEYFTAGWGPYSAKPGSESQIPGVANEHDFFIGQFADKQTIGYPLVGNGRLGLTNVKTRIQNQMPDLNTRTCLHMNPTLIEDSSGRQKMVVYLFTKGAQPSARAGCVLPDGRQLSPGNYLYRYSGAELGWQLDADAGIVGEAGNDALNSIPESHNEVIGTQWGSRNSPTKLQIINIDSKNVTDAVSCHGTNLHFAEATGTWEKIYFIGDYPQRQVPFAHDIFVAYRGEH